MLYRRHVTCGWSSRLIASSGLQANEGSVSFVFALPAIEL